MNREKVAEKLIKLRGKRSQEEVATAVGISKSALSMYENGERIPRDEIKIRLARYYNESVESIFFEKECHEMWRRKREKRDRIPSKIYLSYFVGITKKFL